MRLIEFLNIIADHGVLMPPDAINELKEELAALEAKVEKFSSTNTPCTKWPSFESVVDSLNASLQSRLQRNMSDAEQNIVFSAFLDIGIKLGHIAQPTTKQSTPCDIVTPNVPTIVRQNLFTHNKG